MRRVAWGLVLAGVLVCGVSGCKRKGEKTAAPAKAKLSVVVRPSADSNEDRPLYVVVRAIDEKQFIEDSYSEVAALVIEPDETVIATLVVFPGKNALQELEFDELPAVVGVYCLFTHTQDGAWKQLFEGVEVIDISVGAGAIVLDEDDEND